ncbi:MAG TPA: carboxypeptidase-like regulatory domain-containing protein, partial [Bacteroidia bacterium]|nr:carboxypeptidase-like regulatory domain-containing protein [Bacteroidia bacterium]
MKKNLLVTTTLIAATAILINSCTKPTNGATGPQGPAGPSLSGVLSGHVDLYDQYGSQILNSKTAKVILYNSGNVIIASMNADSTGKYSFSNISTGIYTLAFTDSGYGQQLHQNFQFLGGGDLNVDGKISQNPNFNITAVTVDSINHATGNVVLNCSIVTNTKVRTLLIFASGSSSVSSDPANYLTVTSQSVKANATSTVINIPLSNLYNAGLT